MSLLARWYHAHAHMAISLRICRTCGCACCDRRMLRKHRSRTEATESATVLTARKQARRREEIKSAPQRAGRTDWNVSLRRRSYKQRSEDSCRPRILSSRDLWCGNFKSELECAVAEKRCAIAKSRQTPNHTAAL